MHSRWLGGVLAGATLVWGPRPALACGGGGVTTSEESGVVANTQRIFVSVRPDTTEVIVQIGVPSTTADYGVLIPVAAEPTLDDQPVDEADLQMLDHDTAPKIGGVRGAAAEQDSGCTCTSPKGGDDDSSDGAPTSADAVTVEAPVNIGPVQAVPLTGETGDAVNVWLADNGFIIPEESRPIVDAYAGPGRYFIAIRRSDSATTGGPTSIGIHYTLPGDQRTLSLGFARLGAASTVAFTLFIAAPRLVGPALPFTALTLDDLDATHLRSGDYAGAVKLAVASHNSRAFVVEGTFGPPVSGPSERLRALMDPFSFVTRLSTVVAADQLSADVTFDAAQDGVRPERTVLNRSRSVHYAGFGAFAALALGSILRRRKRAAPR